jgi:AcrR family transcriptional regulator
MTQRAFFTKESVLDAAFALTREKGWESVSARSIARRLGSSTMPIYSSHKSMEEIEQEVRRRAEALMQEYQLRPYRESPSLGMAIGYVDFARKEPNLFRFLYVERPRRLGPSELEKQSQEIQETAPGSAALKEMLDRMPGLKTNALNLKTWIFVHGLATLVSAGALDVPEERVVQLLADAGEAFVSQEMKRKEPNRG